MRNRSIVIIIISGILMTILPGCEFIGDIFKAGVWVGIIAVVVVIAIIGFIIKAFSK